MVSSIIYVSKKGSCVLKCEDGDLTMPEFILEFEES